MILILERPARRHGDIENEWHRGSVFVPLVPRRQKLFRGDPAGALAQRPNALDRLVDFCCRRSASGTKRAIARPWRVMTITSPRSTSSRSWGRWALASEA